MDSDSNEKKSSVSMINFDRKSEKSEKICDKHYINFVKETTVYYKGGNPHTSEYCPLCYEERNDEIVEAQKKAEEEALKNKILKGVPKIYQNSKIIDFNNIQSIIPWIEKPSGFLYVHGECGTGKTHLACAIKKDWNIKNKESFISFSSDLFIRIRSSFNDSGESEADIIYEFTGDRYKRFGIFDDIGAQKISEFVLETWYNIIDKRYRDDIPTMFTSNLSLKELSILMGDRITSRIASGAVFELKGNDKRLQK